MKVTVAMWITAAVVALPGASWANHLDCGRAWPGTPVEANQAWAACKTQDEQEHIRMRREEQRRGEEQREREFQRHLEERRVRALEEAAQAEREKAQAEREKADAIRDAARNMNQPPPPRTCRTYRDRLGAIVTECQ